MKRFYQWLMLFAAGVAVAQPVQYQRNYFTTNLPSVFDTNWPSITLSSGKGFAAYSTSDQSVNFNRVTLTFADPDWTFFNESGGIVPPKNWLFTTPANVLRINGATTTAPFQFTGALNSFPTSPMVQFAVGGTASSGVQRGFGTIFDAHQSGTAGYTAFYDYVTQASVGSGTKLLADFGVASTSLARIDNLGNISRIRGVDYTWPSAQGAASTVLQNDGSGGLAWAVAGGAGEIPSTMVYDCVIKELSGYVTNGSTTLTVTGGSFVSGDIGKTVEIWEPDKKFNDVFITNATHELYTTNTVFLPSAVGKTIEISGGGAGGVSLIGTITAYVATNHVTLSTNSSLTIQSGTASRIVSAPVLRTISAVGGLTSVTLSSAPTMTYTNAHVVYGTDNRTALASDCALAQSTGKQLKLGIGNAMVLLNAANPWAMTLTTNTLVVAGVNKALSQIVIVTDTIPTADGGLLRVDSASLRIRDLTVRAYLPSLTSSAFMFPYTFHLQGNVSGATQYLVTEHVDIYGTGRGVTIGLNQPATAYLWAQDCRWVTEDITTTFFEVDGGIYERRMRDCYLETKKEVTTRIDDTAFNNHVVYDHPNLNEDWSDVQSKANSSAGSLYHLHSFGSPNDTPAFRRFNRCRFSGQGNAILFEKAGPTAEFTDCIFQNAGSQFLSDSDLTLKGGWTLAASDGFISPYSVGGYKVKIIGHNYTNTTTASALISTTTPFEDITVSDCYIKGVVLTAHGSLDTVKIVNSTFEGTSPLMAYFFSTYPGATNSTIQIKGCNFIGSLHDEVFRYREPTVKLEISHNFASTGVPMFHDYVDTGTNSQAWGIDNIYSTDADAPTTEGRTGAQFSGRHILYPINFSSASTISPHADFDSILVTGSATINTILVGGNSLKNSLAYEISLVAAPGSSWAIGSAGNVVALSASARTPGQVYTFRWDNQTAKWREVGLPGGGAGIPGGLTQQLQFNNAGAFAGDPQFLWDGTRNIITNGSNPYLLWRQTNSISGSLAYGIQQVDNGLAFWAFNDALTSSNQLFAVAGSSSGAAKNVQAFGNMLVNSNLTVTGNQVANGSVTANGLISISAGPGKVQYQSDADLLVYGVTRAASQDTNVQETLPISLPTATSFRTYAVSGTNITDAYVPTNYFGNGTGTGGGQTTTNPIVYGPRVFPIGFDSTNLDWATNSYTIQGLSTNASFTNTFQNTTPAAGSQLIYVVNNTLASPITVFFMPGNAITNNVLLNTSPPTTNVLNIAVAPGTTVCEWGYNGSAYFLRTNGPAGGVTSITAGHGLQTYSGTAAITTSDTLEAGYKINAQTGTTYTVTTNDWGKFVTMTNASAVAVTLPQATSTTFQNGFMTLIRNIGPGLVTVTPTTSTIDNNANITLGQGFGAIIVSDGTNYWTKGLPYNGVDLTTAQTLQNKTVKTTGAGGNNTLKWIDYDKWVTPSLADESGAIITTNLASSELSGHATFSGSGATNANWVVYEWAVPDDIDTAVDLKVARFKYTTAGTSTSSITFNIGMQDMADSADQVTISLANFSNWVVMTSSPTSPAANDGFTVSGVTLTSWKSSLTAGHTVHIMINRDGAGDANNDAVTDKFFVLSYGRTQ